MFLQKLESVNSLNWEQKKKSILGFISESKSLLKCEQLLLTVSVEHKNKISRSLNHEIIIKTGTAIWK